MSSTLRAVAIRPRAGITLSEDLRIRLEPMMDGKKSMEVYEDDLQIDNILYDMIQHDIDIDGAVRLKEYLKKHKRIKIFLK